MGTYAEDLSDYVSRLDFHDLPEAAVAKAKQCVLDLIGVALLGSDAPWSRSTLYVMRGLGGKEEATIFRYGDRLPCPNAAFVNGTMAHSYDFDDTSHSVHPGGFIITAALAMAEREDLSGEELLTAIVAGYEVALRVSEADLGKTMFTRGFHPTGTIGVFGAASAAGKLAGLTAKQMTNALGIAGSYASGLLEFLPHGSMTKRFHPGKAASEGIVSVLLAQKGFTGPKTVFEGRDGFFRAYSDKYDVSKLVERLGEEFKIVTRTALKRYPAGHGTHCPIDATLELIREYDIKPEDVDEVVVKTRSTTTYEYGRPLEKKYNPETMLEAQINLPFAVAVTLLRRRFSFEDLSEESLRDTKLREIIRKVRPLPWPEFDDDLNYEFSAIIEISLKDGRTVSHRSVYPRGHPKNLFTDEELQAKFEDCVAKVLTEDKIGEAIKAVDHLEKLAHVRELMQLLH